MSQYSSILIQTVLNEVSQSQNFGCSLITPTLLTYFALSVEQYGHWFPLSFFQVWVKLSTSIGDGDDLVTLLIKPVVKVTAELDFSNSWLQKIKYCISDDGLKVTSNTTSLPILLLTALFKYEKLRNIIRFWFPSLINVCKKKPNIFTPDPKTETHKKKSYMPLTKTEIYKM